MALIRPFSDVDLHAFVDDQVSVERRSAIASYLRAEPSEAARVENWRRQNEAIRSVFAGAAAEPVPIWLTIGQLASGKERLDLAGIDRVGGPGGRPGRRWAYLREKGVTLPWITAFAVLLAFAAGLLSPAVVPQWAAALQRAFPSTPRTEVLGRVAARTLDAHAIFGLDPERPAEMISTGGSDLDAWLARHVAFPVRVPDLRSAGWLLRGGRVVPGESGAAAMLVYEDTSGERLSLLVDRVQNPTIFDTSYVVASGPALVWLDGPLSFGVATSRDPSWLADHAGALYRAVYQARPE